jgi:CHASE2 domain-containing sensor protein/signal transduction histidine kinase
MSAARSGRNVVRQWAGLLACVLVATALAGVFDVLWRADLAIYDAALPLRPAPEDVVIVAVDDASIAELGRWPWPRTTHARLMDQLAQAGVRAVALDILFTEPSTQAPAEDAELAAAIARGPPTVLPLAVEMPSAGRPLRVLPPIPSLAQVAAGTGHVHLELDRDGVGRSVFLREGPGAMKYPHLMLTLLAHAPAESVPVLDGARHPDPMQAGAGWVRDYQMLIPFLGAPGHFSRLSYVDVLQGRISADRLRGKLVLVGMTAQGTGDAYPTPRSGLGVAMPGVEISANVLQALRDRNVVRPVGKPLTILLTLVPIILVALGFLRLSPSQSLILSGVAWLATLGASVFALQVAGYWWPPMAALVALLVMYPLWSWRRLEATQKFLDEELARLARERFPFAVPAPHSPETTPFADVIERRINIAREAVQRARDARRLFADTLKALPAATILVDDEGRIVISNPAAARLFGVADDAALEGRLLDNCLGGRAGDAALSFLNLSRHAPAELESVLQPAGRNVLVRTVPFMGGAEVRVGTIIEITDISELRAAQREREDALRFLSHDMKSPASSLLGLAQLQRDRERSLPPEQLSGRLELLAQRLLALVDGFVGLARAEAVDPAAFQELDLRDALQDAIDEVWAVAQSRRIVVEAPMPGVPLPVQGDRTLLARALINLLGNALKFSPQGGYVRVSCRVQRQEVTVEVEDSGPGVAEEARASLFQRFTRRVHRGPADPGGAGLGLAFVRVVAEKHGGRAWMQGAPSGGSIFTIALPLSAPSGPT